jgi:hypothetical protein
LLSVRLASLTEHFIWTSLGSVNIDEEN